MKCDFEGCTNTVGLVSCLIFDSDGEQYDRVFCSECRRKMLWDEEYNEGD
jgi:hypothetical protein